MFSVAVLSVVLAGAAVIVTPLGRPVAVTLTAPTYPFTRVIVAVAVALPPYATLAVVGADSEKLCAVLLNVAVMVGAEVTTNVHVALVPLHAPPVHPAKVLDAPGASANVMLVPGANVALHAPPQLIPAGLDVTVPVPVPASTILTCGWATTTGTPTPAWAAASTLPGPSACTTIDV
jgi:hypothetical protein